MSGPSVWGPRLSPTRPAVNPALQSSPQVYDWLPNKLFMTLASYSKITVHTVMTWPPITTICFEIWNPIFLVSAMHDIVRFKAVCVDAANRSI